MQTKIFIHGKSYNVDLEAVSDRQITEFLYDAWAKHITLKTRKYMRQGLTAQAAADKANAEFKIEELASAPPDEVEEEAIKIAVEDIEAKLAKELLPLPKNVREHAIVAVQSNDKYYERAKQRLVARAEVVRETLRLAGS